MRNTELPPYDSWLATQLLDSVREIEDSNLMMHISNCNLHSLCNELTLSVNPLHLKAIDLSFFESLSTVNEVPLHYLLSKCINQRCQVRKFDSVTLKRVNGDHRVAKQLHELVLCSLLGNYKISDPSNRPVGAVRDRLFELLRNNGVPSRFLTQLLEHCRSVVMFCLREHVVFALDEQPAVMKQVADLMQFDNYRRIVSQAMSAIRDHMQRMLTLTTSHLYKSCIEYDANVDWASELNFILKPFDDQILQISYRRPKQSFREFMLSVSNRIDTDEAREALVTGEPVAVLVQHVKQFEIQALRQLAERLSDHRVGVLREMVAWFGPFGIPAIWQELIHKLMQEHQTGTTPLDSLKWYLTQIHRFLPRLFQMTQIAAELIEDTRRVRLIGHLPFAYTAYQIEACQTRFGMRPPPELRQQGYGMGSILEHLLYFVYCDVCFATYSLLAEWKSQYKQDYNFGLRDVMVDYQTGEIYCRRNRHNYRGSCSKQPLKRVLLLGNVLEVKRRIVLMCAQERCGRAMKLQPRCDTNQRGRSCCYCTPITQATSTAMHQLIEYYNISDNGFRRCMYCSVELRKASQVYIYPFRVYVCHRHQSHALVQAVNAFMAEIPPDVDEQDKRHAMESMMRELIQQRTSKRKSRVFKRA